MSTAAKQKRNVELIADALVTLRARGASPREVEKTLSMLTWLQQHNRSAATASIGRGVQVSLAGDELAPGLRGRGIVL